MPADWLIVNPDGAQRLDGLHDQLEATAPESLWPTVVQEDGVAVTLTLSLPSDDPDLVAAVEEAAARAGIMLSRVDDAG